MFLSMYTGQIGLGVCTVTEGQQVSTTATLPCGPFIPIGRKRAPNKIFFANPFSWPHTQLRISCCYQISVGSLSPLGAQRLPPDALILQWGLPFSLAHSALPFS